MHWQMLEEQVQMRWPSDMAKLAFSGNTSMKLILPVCGEFTIVESSTSDDSNRWLALAGFDPCLALSHFSNSITDLREIQPLDRLEGKDDSWTGQLFKLWTRATHPSPEQRTEAVSKELERWKTEAGM